MARILADESLDHPGTNLGHNERHPNPVESSWGVLCFGKRDLKGNRFLSNVRVTYL